MTTRGTVIVLDAMNVQVATPASLSEITVYQYTVPSTFFKLNSTLRLTMLVSCGNVGGNRQVRGYFGGVNFLDFLNAASSTLGIAIQRTITNRNSKTIQISEGLNSTGLGISTGAVQTLAINTNTDNVLSITLQKNATTLDLALEKVTLELLP